MRALALAALLVAVPASAQPGGQWMVAAAPRSPLVTNMQARYRPDDPQLVGRLVTLARVPKVDGDTPACDRPAVTRARVPAKRLFAELFPSSTRYGRREIARPADFGVGLAAGAPVNVVRVTCRAARGPQPTYLAAASFALGAGRQALWRRETGEHLLLLTPAAGPVRASFACAAARTASERAICADRQLAGWDRSVAAAFEEGGATDGEQRAWLLERDRCGADRTCLLERMRLRTAELLR